MSLRALWGTSESKYDRNMVSKPSTANWRHRAPRARVGDLRDLFKPSEAPVRAISRHYGALKEIGVGPSQTGVAWGP